MTALYQDFMSDLFDSRQSPLLIEVQKKHFDQLKNDNETFSELVSYRKIYDAEFSDKELTNLIIINAADGEKTQILNTIYHLVSKSLKNKKALDSVLKVSVYFSTLGFAELVDDNITSKISDVVTDYKDKLTEILGDKGSEYITEKPVNIVIDTIENSAKRATEAANERHQLGSELYLSNQAKKCLLELATNISTYHTPHQAMQFTLKLITALGLDAPKLIVINNPYNLDSASLSLLSLLFSHAKDLKQKGQSTNISVLFNYTNQQPYDEPNDAHDLDNNDHEHFLNLKRLRHMVQRYGMLEKPGASIPKVVIRASTFIGRIEELAQLSQSHLNFIGQCKEEGQNTKKSLWTLITGEPGTGKTALVNKHLESIKNNDDSLISSQIRLRLLNQVGHKSQMTGLASLLQSIQSESIRLTQYYQANQNFIVRAINDKEILLKDAKKDVGQTIKDKQLSQSIIKKAVKFIADCASFGTIHGAASAALDAFSLDKSHVQTADAMAADNSVDKKQSQFDQLSMALQHLSHISVAVNGKAAAIPLLLFIDDLQWLDELSAEFILTRLLPQFSAQVLLTARQSDSETSYKLALQEENRSPYRIKLFNIAKLCNPTSNNNVTNTQILAEQKKHIRLTEQFILKGMDKHTLALLIRSVYCGTSQEQSDIVASALIEALTEEDVTKKTQVITLFAVEALNVISDDAFYIRNTELTRLIIQPIKGICKINPAAEKNLHQIVKKVFSLLRKVHIDAFNHDSLQDETKRSFTLSSYAVMEERLFIINQYFAEYGDAATFSLQLSAVIGAPFDSDLISNLITTLRDVDTVKYPELSPLKTYLNQQTGGTLTPEHLDILDEVFEILRRLQQGRNMHQYRHGLFAVFLRQQAKHSLTTFFDHKEGRYTINVFFAYCQEVFDTKLEIFKGMTQPTTEQFKDNLYLMLSLNNLVEFAYGFDKKFWAEGYSNSLNSLAYLYGQTNSTDAGIYLHEKSLAIRERLYAEHPDRWARHYGTSLNNLAISYAQVGRVTDGIRLNEKALVIGEMLYAEHPEESAEDYSRCLTNVAYCYGLVGRKDEGIPLLERAFAVIEGVYADRPDRWAARFSRTMHNLAVSYEQVRRTDDAIHLNERAFAIQEELYVKNPDRWSIEYCESLNNLATSYAQDSRTDDAIRRHEQALVVLGGLYNDNPRRWVEAYSFSLTNLAYCYTHVGQTDKGINYHEQALGILEEPYAEYPDRWSEDYCRSLSNLAYCNVQVSRTDEGMRLHERALAILEGLYANNSDGWGEQCCSALRNLASCYKQVNCMDDAIRLNEQALDILEGLYTEDPVRWAEDYSTSLTNLASCYQQVSRTDDCIRLHERALAMRERLYAEDPNRWAKEYCDSLSNLASSYELSERKSEGISLNKRAVSILEELYAKSPARWANDYSSGLSVLAYSYEEGGYMDDAIHLHEQALAMREELYADSPAQWVKIYSASLKSLARIYVDVGRSDEGICLNERAVAILKELYAEKPIRWAEDYSMSLSSLAISYALTSRIDDGIRIFKEALAILKGLYFENPSLWAEDYSLNLKNLAYCYEQIGRTDEGIRLNEQATAIF